MPGWIRADDSFEDGAKEILALRKQIEKLQAELGEAREAFPPDVRDLAQGSDQLQLEYSCSLKNPAVNKRGTRYWVKGDDLDGIISTTWDELFKELAPALVDGIDENMLLWRINAFTSTHAEQDLKNRYPEQKIGRLVIYSSSLDKILIQLRALELVSVERGRWVLTPYGRKHMVRLLALRR